MVNTDKGKVAKLSKEHQASYPGNKHIKQNEGSHYGSDQAETELPIVLEEE
ncbi:hypothetical protein V1502_08780 [Bacillus sp. SCS-153A]|uniref:hypothetical protein n=1 Tax=Rossellomorea sedimentorum TaxID=3115294 RepID=UPI0039064493